MRSKANGLAVCVLILLEGVCLAQTKAVDPSCEKRIRDTQMIWSKRDPEVMCRGGLPKNAQDCIVEMLNGGRGKLRNADIMPVYAICKTDPSPWMRKCVLEAVGRSAADPKYPGVATISRSCLTTKARLLAAEDSERSRAQGKARTKVAPSRSAASAVKAPGGAKAKTNSKELPHG